jgi:hypothetical protein
MDARFRGDSDNVYGVEDIPTTITCRVASSIMEPYFELAPAEMRKLNRSDRTRADHLVLEGGRDLRQELLRLHEYEVARQQLRISSMDWRRFFVFCGVVTETISLVSTGVYEK